MCVSNCQVVAQIVTTHYYYSLTYITLLTDLHRTDDEDDDDDGNGRRSIEMFDFFYVYYYTHTSQ